MQEIIDIPLSKMDKIHKGNYSYFYNGRYYKCEYLPEMNEPNGFNLDEFDRILKQARKHFGDEAIIAPRHGRWFVIYPDFDRNWNDIKHDLKERYGFILSSIWIMSPAGMIHKRLSK